MIEFIEYGKGKVETRKGTVILDLYQISRKDWKRFLKGEISDDAEEEAVLHPVFSFENGEELPPLDSFAEPDFRALIRGLGELDCQKLENFD